MRLLRYYAIASLISVLAALAAMGLLYHAVVVGGIVALAEHSNVATAQAVLAPIRLELADYLVASADSVGTHWQALPLPPAVDEALNGATREAHDVRRIKIFNRHGIVSASTSAALIGSNGADNPGFVSAMQGHALGNFVYRDTFNPFDRAIEHANLYESYIPVRRRPTEPVLGVLEIYTDINTLLVQAERAQFAILAATVLVLTLLYAALLFIVQRAGKVIDAQHQMISEKTAVLEQLSQRSQRREEHERKKLAADLHEGVAQTLSAIKLTLETSHHASDARVREPELLNSVVPDLQQAIGQVRTMAMDLHPAGLDDLGLGPTIRALCQQFGDARASIRIEPRISVDDASMPSALQIVVYRSIEAGLRMVANQPETSLIRVTVWTQDGSVLLVIEGNGLDPITSIGLSDLAADTLSPLSSLRERTVISGGDLSISRTATGAMTVRASWRVGGAV